MTDSPHEDRTRTCQDRLREAGVDAAVLFPSRNLFYLTGFDEEPSERHLLLFVPSEGDPAFLVPELYAEQVRGETWVSDVRTWSDGDDPVEAMRRTISDLDLSADARVLVDDSMWARFTLDLRRVLPDARLDLASDVLGRLRARKDDAELDAMRRSADVADRTMELVRELGDDAVGMTEDELAAEIRDHLATAGGEGVSFEPIVGSGPNGAMPHHTHGDRTVEEGDPVVLDFGTFVDGYASDQTRTVVFAGDPPEEFEAVHETVLEAYEAGIDAVEPNVQADAVDHAVRSVIEDAGYGDRFVHRTGHGVGLSVHEEPYVAHRSDAQLQPGTVFSVEPGVYLPDRFGVRIEDLVVVTSDGCERLNDTDRGWRVE